MQNLSDPYNKQLNIFEMTNALHDWVFHYNTYTQNWEAATRDNYNNLFSGSKDKNTVIKSSSINTLVSLINKTNGDITKMNKLAK